VRKLAYLGNVAFAVTLLVFWILNASTIPTEGVLILLLLFTLPLINFFALAGSGKEKDFFSLYFERKRLEQRKKIAELKKNIGDEE
jgi:hypothetical protein